MSNEQKNTQRPEINISEQKVTSNKQKSNTLRAERDEQRAEGNMKQVESIKYRAKAKSRREKITSNE